jgi:hypothetical protein
MHWCYSAVDLATLQVFFTKVLCRKLNQLPMYFAQCIFNFVDRHAVRMRYVAFGDNCGVGYESFMLFECGDCDNHGISNERILLLYAPKLTSIIRHAAKQAAVYLSVCNGNTMPVVVVEIIIEWVHDNGIRTLSGGFVVVGLGRCTRYIQNSS